MTIEEGQDIVAKLVKFGYSQDEALTWMNSPHPQLGGFKPRDYSYQEVLAIIDRLESGAFL